MAIDKFDIDYLEINFRKKPVFFFVNHKTAVLCWAKIAENMSEKPNVITFDSHRDFKGGLISGANLLKDQNYCRSKYTPNKKLKHFSKNKEFLDWNLIDGTQNERLIRQEKKFLLVTNDNFIDVAFMKDIVSDVYWYFIEAPAGHEEDRCDDYLGKDHFLYANNVTNFKKPTRPFILDIDLDFFANEFEWRWSPRSEKTLKKYFKLQKELFMNSNCSGMTVALEPSFCGGEKGCLFILQRLCEEFGFESISRFTDLLKKKPNN